MSKIEEGKEISVYRSSDCEEKEGSIADGESVTAVVMFAQWVINPENIGVSSSELIVDKAAGRIHESNLFESSSYAFNVTGSIAYHHLSCYLATLDLNTLSNLNIPYFFMELIGNKREFIIPRKTPKKISGKVSYRFVTIPSKKKTGFIRRSQTA
ncbi:hypothetical protein TNCV_12841 [Trichonephila clavipes]|nr:hypothetical protein TNCV_12841 [Trichonephila clavipes]